MRTATLQDYKRRMLRVLVHIQSNLDEPLDLESLAALACFSPCHFHRVFTGMIGESVKEHVRRLRLERAASQLKLSKAPVTRIAFEAGYESHEAFTRSFHAAFGCAPSRFRSVRAELREQVPPSGLRFSDGVHVANFRTKRTRAMNVRIERLKPIRVAFMRHVGPYSAVGSTWDRFLPVLGKEGLLGGDSMFIGICHDDPEVTPESKIRYDACVSVDDTFAPMGEIGAQVISGGEYAITTHFGPYSGLGGAYAALLGQWLPRSGRELRASPCFEVYLNDPQSTASEDLITDIYAPLSPARAQVRIEGQKRSQGSRR